ncbi:hypothetical protein IAT40_004468 [Kwoniella sp. CBS 6097]
MSHPSLNRDRTLCVLTLSALILAASQVQALRHGAHQLRDLYAYPKYEVQFLNDLPLSKSDAERYTSFGVGEPGEWLRARAGSASASASGSRSAGIIGAGEGVRKSLGDGSGSGSELKAEASVDENHLELVPMNFAHPDEPHGAPYPYLCLMPSPNTTSSQLRLLDQMEDAIVEDQTNGSELDPSQGWAALGHLEGKCLYSKQGWFTYAYCHNSHIRQFRQAPHKHPHPPEGIVPTEDREYDAYTLGQVSPGALQRHAKGGQGQGQSNLPAKSNHQAKADSSNNKAQQANLPRVNANAESGDGRKTSLSTSAGNGENSPTVSFGHGASSRYLVQRWSYGTRCDKTGRPREVEVQIHCSMTTGDMIYMIKELSICQYVVIIHSPYLCGLPGFKSRDLGAIESAGIQCRQVVEDDEFAEWEKEQEQKQSQLALDQAQSQAQSQAQAHAQSDQNAEQMGTAEADSASKNLAGLPFGKRPTGADNTLAALLGGSNTQRRHQQQQQQHFGIQGPEKMFGAESEGDQRHSQLNGNLGGNGDQVDADGGGLSFEDVEILFSGEQVDDGQLREMLKKALNSLSDRTKAKGFSSKGGEEGSPRGGTEGEGDEKVIFYSWEEDDDGMPVLIDTDGDGDGDGATEIIIVDQNGNEIAGNIGKLKLNEDANANVNANANANANAKAKAKDEEGIVGREKDKLQKAVRDFLGQKNKHKMKRGKKGDDDNAAVGDGENDDRNSHGQRDEL